jgi:hypothetical protein
MGASAVVEMPCIITPPVRAMEAKLVPERFRNFLDASQFTGAGTARRRSIFACGE